jgi:RNA-binding protein
MRPHVVDGRFAPMLSPARKRTLRARAHHLEPVILIGQHGLSTAVLDEVARALDDHELIKIRFRGVEREARAAAIARMCADLAADLVLSIGGTAVLFRPQADGAAGARRPS